MNILEQLTIENQDNYKDYLNRMKQSCATSSKHLIPFYTLGCDTILDVGCADGTLMKNIKKVNPQAKVVGIDLNQHAVDLAVQSGLEVYHKSLKEVTEKFDCIIFSSVLHEISSYAESGRFTYEPIKETLKIAYSLLNDNGYVIIRDGLEDDRLGEETWVNATFTNPEDMLWFLKFVKNFKYPYFHDNYEYVLTNDVRTVACEPALIQEFLATWTWGEKSWHREINEKFCIATEKDWIEILRECSLNSIAFFKSKEEYPKFLTPKIKIVNEYGEDFFPFMTCTIIAEKI